MFGIELENFDYSKLHWQSDWNGFEIGYDSIDVVGLYCHGELNMYIDMETNRVLEMWFDYDEEEVEAVDFTTNKINDMF